MKDQDMPALAPISEAIWDMKYRLKAADGTPIDRTIDDTWRRVATALAAPEAEPGLWVERFYNALAGYRFLPAGRILAGAGAARKVTLFNCFVMGRIPDDMSGIFEHLREAALTMQQGGGIGYDFSTLRPQGALVRGVGADASGPLSFMDVWDAMCSTIMSAGARRGAMMATLRCDHPDIEAFIDAKQTPGRLTNFNLSVLITDPFMDAVAADTSWDLTFEGTVYRTVRAQDLWDRIMRGTYDYAEPGVIFIDRINRWNNLWYCEDIYATNPCVTGDTWVMTTQGPAQVETLQGREIELLVDGTAHKSSRAGFFETGHKPVLRLRTEEGHMLRLTPDHRVRVAVSETRWRVVEDWRAAGDLKPGDRVRLHGHSGITWPGPGTAEQGYLLGLLIGDGTLKTDKAVLSVWRQTEAVNGGDAPWPTGIMNAALAAARTLPHRSDFSGWYEITGRGEQRMALAALPDLAGAYGLAPGAKIMTPALEETSSAFQIALLRGLFDCDGSVQGTQTKGISIRLAQSDQATLQAVQRMLARLGIVSTLYADRRGAGTRDLPDGKGGSRGDATRAQHELVIARANVQVFAERIGFADSDKQTRLTHLLQTYKRALNRERFLATVASIDPDGTAAVYDVQVPGINAFDANGLYVHNCGEQPLPPYGACLLGSINLATLVRTGGGGKPFTADAALDLTELEDLVRVAVRMMDNVVDISNFPLDAQRREAKSKRRIGLGVTGLADALILCGLRYGSPDAVAATRRWMAAIRFAAYSASIELAREKGPFPVFDADSYLAGPTIQALEPELRGEIARHGIRNALLTSIAPTGTISLFADNVSSGIEPVFAFTYTRKVLQPDGTRRAEEVSDPAWRLWQQLNHGGGPGSGGNAPLPDAFVDAQTLTPAEHVAMQAAAQEFIDSSISKTINCPPDLPFDAFKDVYRQAYDQGCKGCTTYRPSGLRGAVLEVKGPAAQAPAAPAAGGPATMTPAPQPPAPRPEALTGQTYKIKWPESDHAIYITINDAIFPDDNAGSQSSGRGVRRPFEIFINSKNMEHYAWTVALTRMISAVFRRGGDINFVPEELKAVFDPRGGQWMGGRYVPSLLAAIGAVIERHLAALAQQEGSAAAGPPAPDAGAAPHAPPPEAMKHPTGQSCPKCGSPGLHRQEGCETCLNCGYSKCS